MRVSLDVRCLDHGTLGLLFDSDETRGCTFLGLVAQAKYRNAAEAAVDLLLEQGAQLNQLTGSCGHTPLPCTILGVAGRNVINVESFVGRIAKGNTYEDRFKLQLFDGKYTDCDVLATKLLLEKGADPLFVDRNGKSALTVAGSAWKNDIRVVKMLLEYIDQNLPISTIKAHILAAMAPFDASCGACWDKERPSLTIQKTLWIYYWRKVYPRSNE